jgi:hypothetical protein
MSSTQRLADYENLMVVAAKRGFDIGLHVGDLQRPRASCEWRPLEALTARIGPVVHRSPIPGHAGGLDAAARNLLAKLPPA